MRSVFAAIAMPMISVAFVMMTMQPVRADWSVPANYTFEAPAFCADGGAERAAQALRLGQARYEVCADQMALFQRGLAEARKSGKLLLITFGATWCPWCASLQKKIQTEDVLKHQGEALDYAAAFHHIEIGVSTLDKGKRADLSSGEAVLASVLKQTPAVRIRAIPFVAVIDPANPQRTFARNIDDLAQASYGYDMGRLRAVLREAHAHVRKGQAASAEPSWIVRKWRQWWSG